MSSQQNNTSKQVKANCHKVKSVIIDTEIYKLYKYFF